jgi:hypothetical protein
MNEDDKSTIPFLATSWDHQSDAEGGAIQSQATSQDHQSDANGGAIPKQLTENEIQERIRALKTGQTAALSRVTKKRNEITNLMVSESTLHLVKDGYNAFNDLCAAYQNAHEEYDVVLSEYDQDKESKRFDEKQISIIEFRGQVFEWIKRAERSLQDQCDSASAAASKSHRSHHSHSTRSSESSSVESSAHARAREKANIAALIVEKAMLERQQTLKNETDKLKLDLQIAKATARERVYADIDNVQHEVSIRQMTAGPSPMLNPEAPTFQPGYNQPTDNAVNNYSATRTNFVNNQTDHLVTTDTLLTALSLPHPEIPKFKGELTEYRPFIMAFDTRVASRVHVNADKLYYLDQHLIGEPRDVIGGCFYMNTDEGYLEARRLLEKEYGDPYKVSMVYLNRVLEWPVIKQDDNIGLRQFSLFLTKCHNAMKCMSYLNVLNHPPNMQSIVQKLPPYLQNKWRDHACKMRKLHAKIMVYEDMHNFVESAAESANDPVYGHAALHQNDSHLRPSGNRSNPSPTSFQKQNQKSSSFAAYVNATSDETNANVGSCKFCKQRHDIDDCSSFKAKTVEERRNFLKEKHMCFACYGTGHVAKGCTNKRTCKTCKRRHPTALHI